MANLKTVGIVLLVGALTTYLIIRQNSAPKPEPKVLNATLYNSWKAQHRFQFSAGEDKYRGALFQKNLNTINEHNAKPNQSFELGVNHFAGYTREEFSALYLGEHKEVQEDPSRITRLNTSLLGDLTTIDWTNKGAVTPVKNQGRCGSCYSFSATGAIEGLLFVTNGTLASFSEQQIVDCSDKYQNQGCSGGLALWSFMYVTDNGGIVQEHEYPYKAANGTCNIPENASRYKINNYTQVPRGDVAQIKAALSKQPLAISLQADSDVFRFYKGGIMDSDACGTSLNHAVLATGFDDGKYWRIKNSWGPEWGVSGYILLGMRPTGDGVCGVHIRPTYPLPAIQG